MRIIQPGILSMQELKKVFGCMRCGCVFEAERTEYRVKDDYRNGVYYEAVCPCCGEMAHTEGG